MSFPSQAWRAWNYERTKSYLVFTNGGRGQATVQFSNYSPTFNINYFEVERAPEEDIHDDEDH
jgi:hypothetical protein